MKYCIGCKTNLDFGYFAKRGDRPNHTDDHKSKYKPRCMSCESINTKLRFFNISLDEFHQLRLEHKDCCGICGVHELDCRNNKTKHFGLYIDHCHSTGNVRGLLCHNCNLTIGHAKDNIEILKSAIQYLTS